MANPLEIRISVYASYSWKGECKKLVHRTIVPHPRGTDSNWIRKQEILKAMSTWRGDESSILLQKRHGERQIKPATKFNGIFL